MPICLDEIYNKKHPITSIPFIEQSVYLDELQYQREEVEIHRDERILMYKLLSEVTISSMNESAESILHTIKDWIKRAIEHLKRLLHKFWKTFQGWIDEEQYVKNNKDILKQYGSYAFPYKGFKFSFKDDTAICDIFKDISHEIAGLVNDCNTGNPEVLVNRLHDAYHRAIINNTDEYLGHVRAKMLGGSGYVGRDEFNGACKKYFRSGRKKDTPEIIMIDKTYINGLLEYVTKKDGYAGMKRKVETEASNVYNMLISIEKNLSALIKATSKFRGDQSENAYAMAIAHANRLSTCANTIYRECMIYFTLKLQAIKDMAIQNNKIAVEAIHKIKDFRKEVPA